MKKVKWRWDMGCYMPLEKPRAERVGFSSHDGETYYKCPICLKTFGDMLIDSNDVRCPYCEAELEGIE